MSDSDTGGPDSGDQPVERDEPAEPAEPTEPGGDDTASEVGDTDDTSDPSDRGLLPASGAPAGAGGGGPGRSTLRRYGPIAVVLVLVAAVVTGAVVLRDDGDDEPSEGGTAGPATGELPEGVVTASMAQQQGLDVTFPDSCDTESGMVAIPFFFRTECVADVADNGGATSPGVTAEEVRVVLWLPNPGDPIYGFVRQALGFDDTVDEIRETQEGLIEIFQAYYQTYGRTVRFEFVQASAGLLDQTAAQADAVRALEFEPFAALGGPPAFGTAWTEELQARGVLCIMCSGGDADEPPYAYGLQPSGAQLREHTVNYVTRKLAGKPAEHAGADLRNEERVFANLKLAMGEGDERDARNLDEELAAEGVELAETITYPLAPGAMQEHATSAITRMKEAGVTTVLADTDPLTLPDITREATEQNWFPEWVLTAPSLFADTNAFGRNMDPEQWEHAFGISYLPPSTVPEANPAYQLYEWFHGEPPPAPASLLLTYPQVALFFIGLEFAGPNLTPETFRDGLFAYPPTPQARSQPSVDYGTAIWDEEDYAGIDDMVELWWDPEARGTDETGQPTRGMYRYVDGAQRYYAADWPRDLRVFDPDGTVTQIEEPPREEVPPDYPSPSG
jgi:hypothetical protein